MKSPKLHSSVTKTINFSFTVDHSDKNQERSPPSDNSAELHGKNLFLKNYRIVRKPRI